MTDLINLNSEFFGHLDSADVVLNSDRSYSLRLYGWVTHVSYAIKRIEFSALGSAKISTELFNRPDVPLCIPSIGQSLRSGYCVNIPLKEKPTASEIVVSVSILLSNGVHSICPLVVRIAEDESSYSSAESVKNFDSLCAIQFEYFIKAKEKIIFEPFEPVEVSAIIVVHNKAHLTHACLKSLVLQQRIGLEVIIVDNNSTDQTSYLLDRVYGARIIKNSANAHFINAANQGALMAKGKYLLFLNNDLVLLPGALSAALKVYRGEENIGAVGAKLIRPDGKLQEAGSLILEDGSTLGRGVGEDAFTESFNVRTDVDYCSGAFLLTPRELFKELGMFDASYAPAYYEDVDYCVRLKEYDYRVIYDPDASAIHMQHGSAKDNQEAKDLMSKNRTLFAKRHSAFLKNSDEHALNEKKVSTKILFIDDYLPNDNQGQGQPRCLKILQALSKMNVEVTFLGLKDGGLFENLDLNNLSNVSRKKSIDSGDLSSYIKNESKNYSHVFVSRPTNMEILNKLKHNYPDSFRDLKIIYDAEALFALRDIRKKQVLNNVFFSEEEINHILKIEIDLANNSDVIVVVSDDEFDKYSSYSDITVKKLMYPALASERSPDFASRKGIVYIGPMLDLDSPNVDAIRWFAEEVVPYLDRTIIEDGIRVAGFYNESIVNSLQGKGIQFIGPVEDAKKFLETGKIFIAPQRFGAGIPLKVIEAAAAGIPCIVSELVDKQLRWENGQDYIVANSSRDFAGKINSLYVNQLHWNQIQKSAFNRIKIDHNPEKFENSLKQIIYSK